MDLIVRIDLILLFAMGLLSILVCYTGVLGF